MDIDTDIRSKIIIPDNVHRNNVINYSNIELAAIHSKNDNNFTILKLLLEKNKTNIQINNILKQTIEHLDRTSSYDAVNLLVRYGADINFSDAGGWTPLMNSCFYLINIKIIEFLIENGSDVNVKRCYYNTPLTVLINSSWTCDHLEIIKLLIRKGSHVNFKDLFLVTPLMMCFNNKKNNLIRYDVIKLLLDNKADVYIKNIFGNNIFNIIKDKIGIQYYKNSDIYSLVFNYKNLVNDHLCKSDIDFIYYK